MLDVVIASLRVRLSLTLNQKRAFPDWLLMSSWFSEPNHSTGFILLKIHFLAAQRRFDQFWKSWLRRRVGGRFFFYKYFDPLELLTATIGKLVIPLMLEWNGQNIRLPGSKPQRCPRPVGVWIRMPGWERQNLSASKTGQRWIRTNNPNLKETLSGASHADRSFTNIVLEIISRVDLPIGLSLRTGKPI